ncbi:MAG TPA: DUF3237 domain-containing protein [Steroidobacteraceae bacterium]|nr:DUF3237 domain-containing protein [Steroidobacteraceae bacterium]
MDYRSATPRLEHVFDVRIDFKDRWIFGPIHPGGPQQGYTSVLKGRIEGPRLNGKVVDVSGADWPVVRSDGVVELNAHYMLEADDGARIYVRNQGYVYGPRPAQDGLPERPGYFRCTPYFRAPHGPHEWLNRTVIIGGGERHPDPAGDYSIFRYWAVY